MQLGARFPFAGAGWIVDFAWPMGTLTYNFPETKILHDDDALFR
jgi:hypothetical protein